MVNQTKLGALSFQSISEWIKSHPLKFWLGVCAAIAVVLLVLFSSQLGNLFRLFGSRAALETGNIILNGDPTQSTNHQYFLDSGYTAERFNPATGNWDLDGNAVDVDPQNRLVVNP